MRVVLGLVLAVTLAAALIDHETKEEFKAHMQKYGKHHDNPIEYAKRQAIYAKNKLARAVHNLKFQNGEIGWEEEDNEFSDLTTEEFIKRLGYDSAYENKTDGAQFASEVFGNTKRFANIDWRNSKKDGKVKNQANCGSC